MESGNLFRVELVAGGAFCGGLDFPIRIEPPGIFYEEDDAIIAVARGNAIVPRGGVLRMNGGRWFLCLCERARLVNDDRTTADLRSRGGDASSSRSPRL